MKIYTSPAFVDNELRVTELCLTGSTNNQYKLKLLDSYGDSWVGGSYLKFEGINGNTVYKGYLTAKVSEEYDISFYYGANKNDEWKMTSGSVTGEWTQYSFPESGWSQVTLGSVTTSASGTQYFRKTFAGLSNMAAYELGMNYRYGVVAYINGAEVYRDNMPEGPVTSSTPASGSYPLLDYRSVIRPGYEVANSQSVIAIELHFTSSASQTTVDFNAYLSLLAASTSTDNCFVYPYNSTLTMTGGADASIIFNFNKFDLFTISSDNLPATIDFSFEGAKPFINGIRVFPYTYTTTATTTFQWEGSSAVIGGTWSTVISVSDLEYTTETYKLASGFFNAGLFAAYRLKMISSSSGGSASFVEAQPVICGVSAPTSIEFSQATYQYYAKYDNIIIAPKVSEFVNCQISPAVAEGLTFNSASCTVSGMVNTPASYTYTVTSVVNGQTYTGSFQLNIIGCSGTMINIHREYKLNPANEGYRLVDANTQEEIVVVNTNSGQIANSVVDEIFCLTGQKYTVHTMATTSSWQSTSFLYVKGILDQGAYETIIRAKYDSTLGLPSAYTFNTAYSIHSHQEWKYKMGTVPSNWYNTDMTGWDTGAVAGNFPASTNQIQLYKKQFTVASVQDMIGVSISLKYRYGAMIYLNGHEAFRVGFTGELTTSTLATLSFSSLSWRQVSLPIRTFVGESSPAVDYIVAGTNTIAVALIGSNASQTDSSFDCAVRLMGTESQSRVFDLSVSKSNINGFATSLHNFHYSYYITYSYCGTNYYQLTFANGRHEWISSVTVKLFYTQTSQYPTQFVLKAKKSGESTWTTLKTVTGLTWSQAGQKNRIWIPNNTAYNVYRFENIGTGNGSSCTWRVGQIDILSDSTNASIPALTYEPTTIFKDIEMAELYPNSDLYYDFSVNPPLPNGITINTMNGMISGTATEFMTSTTYTVSAKKYNGEPVTSTLTLSVEPCFGGKNLITMVARIDASPSQSSYRLYQGRNNTGIPIKQIDQFKTASALNYADFCLAHGIYTLELRDTVNNGWSAPGGYYMTVDVGAMKFEMGQVYTGSAPTIVTTMFSSYLPFQAEYDDWKVYKDLTTVASNWNAVDFDDSTWTVTKADQIGMSEAITVYIRHDITLDDASHYHVLNICAKYVGGLVAYFNGRKFARFNLIDEFNADTESIGIHDSTVFSQFHAVLPTVGVVTGKNVIAFEVHRPAGQSSSQEIVFDATGVFGVNDCSIGVDTVYNITASAFSSIGSLENFFDLTPVTNGFISNAVGNFLQWTVENLEGTKFNSFAMETVYTRSSFGFSIYANQVPENIEERQSIFSKVGLSTSQRKRCAWDVPVGIAGFKQIRWEIDDAATAAVTTSAYILQYCKASGEGSCPGIGDYPAVGEGQISPSSCEYGYRGYSYRECSEGVLGEIKTDMCKFKIPLNLRYNADRFTLVMDTQITIPAPTYDNLITEFYLAENTFLPDGLTLDPTNGSITGVPTSESGIKAYTIYGKNPETVTLVVINISVRKGECKAEGYFQKTPVGEVAMFDCALQGSYVGSQKRGCILGAQDGEWQEIQGVCVATMTLVILIVLVIVVILVVVFIFVRTSKKSNPVGGMKKGGKTSKGSPSKKMDKKPTKTTVV